MQDRLKQIGRGKPGEIQQASEWLGELPRDNHAIGQLPHIVWAGHPGFQKHADGWRTRAQPSADVSETVESSNGGSDSAVKLTVRIDITRARWRTESNRSRRRHGKRTPPLP